MPVIEVEGLRKEYRRFRKPPALALDDLTMAVPDGGGVFGFLGPNGSGKTTTIRCLLALVRPSRGRCRLLGAEPKDLAGVIRRVGSLVESPTFFPNFSGRRNLELLGRLDGVGPKAVSAVLDRVGLASRAGDRYKAYSLGMKQRLGIAAALLRDPEVLILDEPANGLDPAGIKEVRDLLRVLGDEGRTIFLSSHLLGEVQQICDRVAILSRGRCIAAGPVDEVLSRGRPTGLVVRLDDLDAGLAALQAAGLEASRDGDGLRVNLPATDAARVTRALAERGLYLTELRPEEVSLERVFLELTGEAEHGAVPPANAPRPDPDLLPPPPPPAAPGTSPAPSAPEEG
jgi:ABC-2 type transport system ATP-binding protein